MLYSKDILVKANTLETDRKKETIKVSDGIIHLVEIWFRNGCRGYVKVVMFDGSHQFVSSSEGQYVSGDGTVVKIPEFYEIKGGPRQIRVEAWSPGSSYNHTIQARIYVLPKEHLLPAGMAETFIQMLRHVFVDAFERGKKNLEKAGEQ